MVNAKDLEEQFGVIERRIKAITSENRALTERIAELEREIAGARKDAQTREHVSGITGQVRERIEKVLLSLETIGTGKPDA
jgi:predicted  nucleic acid-binding Zn-ribbon protein